MSTIVLAVVTIVGTFGFMIFMKKRLNRQYAHMCAGDVAKRLGMELREGNPAFNLATMSVQPSVHNIGSAGGFLKQVAATSVGGKLGEFKLHMAGQPYGVNAELVLYCRQELEKGYTEDVETTWHDLRLTVHARCPIPGFDLRLRKETAGLPTRRECDEPRMPAQAFGDPSLDERYAIETADGSVPRRIAGVLRALPPHMMYVHFVGVANRVSFVMTPASVNSTAMNIDAVLHVVASIVAVFEGRAVPGIMTAAPAPVARA